MRSCCIPRKILSYSSLKSITDSNYGIWMYGEQQKYTSHWQLSQFPPKANLLTATTRILTHQFRLFLRFCTPLHSRGLCNKKGEHFMSCASYLRPLSIGAAYPGRAVDSALSACGWRTRMCRNKLAVCLVENDSCLLQMLHSTVLSGFFLKNCHASDVRLGKHFVSISVQQDFK